MPGSKADHAFDTVTALLYDEVSLFVAGKPSNESTWLTRPAAGSCHRFFECASGAFQGGLRILSRTFCQNATHVARYYYRKIANATGSGNGSVVVVKRKEEAALVVAK